MLPFCHLAIKAQKTPHADRWKSAQGIAKELHTIGEHIRNRRLELRLLQRTVAEHLCVHIESLKNWERGVGAPSIRQMPKIIEFLGYDPEPQPETLARRLAHARRRLGLTQEDLAEKLDVDPGTIPRGRRAISFRRQHNSNVCVDCCPPTATPLSSDPDRDPGCCRGVLKARVPRLASPVLSAV